MACPPQHNERVSTRSPPLDSHEVGMLLTVQNAAKAPGWYQDHSLILAPDDKRHGRRRGASTKLLEEGSNDLVEGREGGVLEEGRSMSCSLRLGRLQTLLQIMIM